MQKTLIPPSEQNADSVKETPTYPDNYYYTYNELNKPTDTTFYSDNCIPYQYFEPALDFKAPCIGLTAQTKKSTLSLQKQTKEAGPVQIHLFIYAVDSQMIEGMSLDDTERAIDKNKTDEGKESRAFLPRYNIRYPYLKIKAIAKDGVLSLPVMSYECVLDTESGDTRFANECVRALVDFFPEWESHLSKNPRLIKTILCGLVKIGAAVKRREATPFGGTPLHSLRLTHAADISGEVLKDSMSFTKNAGESKELETKEPEETEETEETEMCAILNVSELVSSIHNQKKKPATEPESEPESEPEPTNEQSAQWYLLDELLYSPTIWKPDKVCDQLFRQHPAMRFLMISSSAPDLIAGAGSSLSPANTDASVFIDEDDDMPEMSEMNEEKEKEEKEGDEEKDETVEKGNTNEYANEYDLTAPVPLVVYAPEAGFLPVLDEQWGWVYKYTSKIDSVAFVLFATNVFYNIDATKSIEDQQLLWQETGLMYQKKENYAVWTSRASLLQK